MILFDILSYSIWKNKDLSLVRLAHWIMSLDDLIMENITTYLYENHDNLFIFYYQNIGSLLI
jgi:hypothetical protein